MSIGKWLTDRDKEMEGFPVSPSQQGDATMSENKSTMTYAEAIRVLRDMYNNKDPQEPIHIYSQTTEITALRTVVEQFPQLAIMPEEPSDAIVMQCYGNGNEQHTQHRLNSARQRYDRLRAALTTPPKPKTKMATLYSYTYALKLREKWTPQSYSDDLRQDVEMHRRDRLARPAVYANISEITEQQIEIPA